MKNNKVAVFCHIYYGDLVDECLSYLLNTPSYVDIYISYSKEDTKHYIENVILEQERNINIIEKCNRGRDVAALLVTFRDVILKYQYFCFVHDKKSMGGAKNINSPHEWRRLYFDCLLHDEAYIQQVIERFEQDFKLGLQVPPAPFEGEYLYSFGDPWLSAKQAGYELCEKLNLQIDLEDSTIPVLLGTTFWARTDALKDLLDYNFTYEDFPEEPMSHDGTISHGVERILAFLAANRGYYTFEIMPDEIARDRERKLEKLSIRLLNQLRKESMLKEDYIDNWYEYHDKLSTFCKGHPIYIYGAGFWGSKALNIIENIGGIAKGYIVSKGHKVEDEFNGLPVNELDDIEDKSVKILIAIYDRNNVASLIENNLKEKGFLNCMILH